MQTKVKTHKRKGRVVVNHMRKVKKGGVVALKAPKTGAGGEIAKKVAAAPSSPGRARFAKGSAEAKAHMAKIRAMRK